MNNLKQISDRIRDRLDETNRLREESLRLSRETIRLSATSIRASHRGEFPEAIELKAQARAKVDQVAALLAERREIYYTGYVQDAQKEYAESELTHAFIRETDLPSFEELGVEPAAYLNGLGEAIGECRRHVLDVLRQGDLMRAERILEIMDEVYYVLITFDYPDAVTQNLRRNTDMVRGVVERTRADVTIVRQQQALERAIQEALIRYQNEPSTPGDH